MEYKVDRSRLIKRVVICTNIKKLLLKKHFEKLHSIIQNISNCTECLLQFLLLAIYRLLQFLLLAFYRLPFDFKVYAFCNSHCGLVIGPECFYQVSYAQHSFFTLLLFANNEDLLHLLCKLSTL